MKEIKFRYYNAASKVMHPNVYYAIDLDGNFLMSMPLPEGVYPPKDRRFTITELHKGDALMQYTGLKDKNGVEIYEGDLVSNYDDGAYPYTVLFDQERAQFMKMRKGRLSMLTDCPYLAVIGNIHENPELLESKQ